MKPLFPLLASLCLFTFAACDTDTANADDPAASVFLGTEGFDFTSAYARYERIAPPNSSRVQLILLGGNASITSTGEFLDLPADQLSISLQVPNTDGNIIDGLYPVSRIFPTEELFVGNGFLSPNFNPTGSNLLEIQSGTVEIIQSEGSIRVILDLQVQDVSNSSGGQQQLQGEVEVPLVIL